MDFFGTFWSWLNTELTSYIGEKDADQLVCNLYSEIVG